MSRKEKIEGMKQESKAKKPVTGKTAKGKVQDVHPDEEMKKIQEELKSFADKTVELQDKYLRLSAEFDNYRKRTHKEKTDLIKTASEDLLKDHPGHG